MNEWKITDELLVRYIDGLTTAEEDARIEAALAADAALMEEFVLMAEAARLADSTPVKKPDMNNVQMDVCNVIRGNNVTKHRNLWIRVAAVAGAVAAVLLVVLLVVKPFKENPTLVAQNDANASETNHPVDARSEEGNSEVTNHSQSEIIIENQKDESITADNRGFAEAQPGETSANDANEVEVLTVQKLEKNYASSAEANHLSIEKPSKVNYRLLCKNLDKNFTFQWKASNVKTLTFTIKNKQGKTIAELNDAQADHFAVSYHKLYPENYLIWCVSVIYNDGKREQKSGVLQIDYDIQ